MLNPPGLSGEPISGHQINKGGSSYVSLSYSLYRNNINENITNKAVKELINQKPFSYLCSTKLLQKSEMRKEIVIELSYKGFSRASDYS